MAKKKWILIKENDAGMKAMIKLYGDEKLEEWFRSQYGSYQYLVYKEYDGERFVLLRERMHPSRQRFPGDKTIESRLSVGNATLCDDVDELIRYLSNAVIARSGSYNVDIHQIIDGKEWHIHMGFASKDDATKFIDGMEGVTLWCPE